MSDQALIALIGVLLSIPIYLSYFFIVWDRKKSKKLIKYQEVKLRLEIALLVRNNQEVSKKILENELDAIKHKNKPPRIYYFLGRHGQDIGTTFYFLFLLCSLWYPYYQQDTIYSYMYLIFPITVIFIALYFISFQARVAIDRYEELKIIDEYFYENSSLKNNDDLISAVNDLVD